MLADEVRDLGLRALVESIVGRSHVRELGVGAPRGNDAPREQRVLGGRQAEGAVGMP